MEATKDMTNLIRMILPYISSMCPLIAFHFFVSGRAILAHIRHQVPAIPGKINEKEEELKLHIKALRNMASVWALGTQFADTLEEAYYGDCPSPLSHSSRADKSLVSSLLDLRLSPCNSGIINSREKLHARSQRGTTENASHSQIPHQSVLQTSRPQAYRTTPYTIPPVHPSHFPLPTPSRHSSISISPDNLSSSSRASVTMTPFSSDIAMLPDDISIMPSTPHTPDHPTNLMQQLSGFQSIPLPTNGFDYDTTQFTPQVDWSDLERILNPSS